VVVTEVVSFFRLSPSPSPSKEEGKKEGKEEGRNEKEGT
jgi:hypothetical protein